MQGFYDCSQMDRVMVFLNSRGVEHCGVHYDKQLSSALFDLIVGLVAIALVLLFRGRPSRITIGHTGSRACQQQAPAD